MGRNTLDVWIVNAMALFTTMLCQSCSALQYASFHKPVLAERPTSVVDHGDAIVFEVPSMCVELSDDIPSATYRVYFIGPLFFPVIPYLPDMIAERISHYGPWDGLAVEITVEPKTADLTFDLSRVTLITDYGERITPSAYGLHRRFEVPQALRTMEMTNPPIIAIKKGFQPGEYGGPLVTSVYLAFKRTHPEAQIAGLAIEGLYGPEGQVSIPKVTFTPVSGLRFLPPGRSMQNTWAFENRNSKGVCGLLPS
jgi:hypothetical protein